MVSTPVREAVLPLGATEKTAVPVPDPDPEVVSQLTLLLANQGQPVVAITTTLLLPPVASKFCLGEGEEPRE